MELLERLRSEVGESDRLPFQEKQYIIRFSGGALLENSYIVQDDIAFWSLIAISYAAERRLFFEVSEVDCDPLFQVYGDKNGFCLFKDTYDGGIQLYGDLDTQARTKELLVFSELSWGLTYFLPKSAFVEFKEIIQVGNSVISDGMMKHFTIFKQDYTSLGISPEQVPDLPIRWQGS